MRLYLMRHGAAVDPAEPSARCDAERALTAQGRARVERMGASLLELGAEPALFLASPLVRAQQTAQIVAARFPKAKLKTSHRLAPGSAPKDLLEEVAALPLHAVACVGHSPHLELVIAQACAGVEFPICELKKAGLACLDFDPASRRGVIQWVLRPGLVRRLG